MVQPLHQSLRILFCRSPEEAIERGFVYRAPDYQPIEVDQVVVIEDGTVGGRKSYDFVLRDANGQKYVFMLTENLLKTIP